MVDKSSAVSECWSLSQNKSDTHFLFVSTVAADVFRNAHKKKPHNTEKSPRLHSDHRSRRSGLYPPWCAPLSQGKRVLFLKSCTTLLIRTQEGSYSQGDMKDNSSTLLLDRTLQPTRSRKLITDIDLQFDLWERLGQLGIAKSVSARLQPCSGNTILDGEGRMTIDFHWHKSAVDRRGLLTEHVSG